MKLLKRVGRREHQPAPTLAVITRRVTPSICERRGHSYRLTTGVWTCRHCGDEVDRDCRAGCVFAADGVNCEDVVRCELQPR